MFETEAITEAHLGGPINRLTIDIMIDGERAESFCFSPALFDDPVRQSRIFVNNAMTIATLICERALK